MSEIRQYIVISTLSLSISSVLRFNKGRTCLVFSSSMTCHPSRCDTSYDLHLAVPSPHLLMLLRIDIFGMAEMQQFPVPPPTLRRVAEDQLLLVIIQCLCVLQFDCQDFHVSVSSYLFLQVQYREEYKSFTHFLTSVCAIVGGVFTVSGLIDSFIYHGQKVSSRL